MFYIVTLSSILLSLNPLKHATTEEYNQTLSTATQCHLFSLLLQKLPLLVNPDVKVKIFYAQISLMEFMILLA